MSNTPLNQEKSCLNNLEIFLPKSPPSRIAIIVEHADTTMTCQMLMLIRPIPNPTPNPSSESAMAREAASAGESLRDWSLSASRLSM